MTLERCARALCAQRKGKNTVRAPCLHLRGALSFVYSWGGTLSPLGSRTDFLGNDSDGPWNHCKGDAPKPTVHGREASDVGPGNWALGGEDIKEPMGVCWPPLGEGSVTAWEGSGSLEG